MKAEDLGYKLAPLESSPFARIESIERSHEIAVGHRIERYGSNGWVWEVGFYEKHNRPQIYRVKADATIIFTTGKTGFSIGMDEIEYTMRKMILGKKMPKANSAFETFYGSHDAFTRYRSGWRTAVKRIGDNQQQWQRSRQKLYKIESGKPVLVPDIEDELVKQLLFNKHRVPMRSVLDVKIDKRPV